MVEIMKCKLFYLPFILFYLTNTIYCRSSNKQTDLSNNAHASQLVEDDNMQHNFNVQSEKRSKRYVLSKEKWTKDHLSYYIKNCPTNIDCELIHANIELAFSLWAPYSGISFYQIESVKELRKYKKKHDSEPDITIEFLKGKKHGLDGTGAILALSDTPSHDQPSSIYFDIDEKWNIYRKQWNKKLPTVISSSRSTKGGADFLAVAIHEIGHVLGLRHSTVSNSVLSPYSDNNEGDTRLSCDDILGITKLYRREYLCPVECYKDGEDLK